MSTDNHLPGSLSTRTLILQKDPTLSLLPKTTRYEQLQTIDAFVQELTKLAERWLDSGSDKVRDSLLVDLDYSHLSAESQRFVLGCLINEREVVRREREWADMTARREKMQDYAEEAEQPPPEPQYYFIYADCCVNCTGNGPTQGVIIDCVMKIKDGQHPVIALKQHCLALNRQPEDLILIGWDSLDEDQFNHLKGKVGLLISEDPADLEE